MRLKTFPGGVHPHDYKHYSASVPIEELPLPQKVIISLSQHIGSPSTPLVKVGDEVKAGQKIADASGFVSIPQHSSISGKVSKIDIFPHPSGTPQLGIEISSDGSDNWVELADDPNYLELSPQEIRSRIAEAGICGMGGAGFPSVVKLSRRKTKPIDTVILTGGMRTLSDSRLPSDAGTGVRRHRGAEDPAQDLNAPGNNRHRSQQTRGNRPDASSPRKTAKSAWRPSNCNIHRARKSNRSCHHHLAVPTGGVCPWLWARWWKT